MQQVGIITQARMGSSRLPGKVMLTVKDTTLLEHHFHRLKETGFPIVVATSTLPQEKPILDLCSKLGIPVTCGSETDVLSRYFLTWQNHPFETIVRVTSDCPLIDPGLICAGVEEREKLQRADRLCRVYYSNTIDRTYARGFDFEVFDSVMLSEAHLNSKSQIEREHVTPYFYLNKSKKIKIFQKKQVEDHSFLRVTVDEPEDLKLISILMTDFDAENMNYKEIEEVLLARPELRTINHLIEQKKL